MCPLQAWSDDPSAGTRLPHPKPRYAQSHSMHPGGTQLTLAHAFAARPPPRERQPHMTTYSFPEASGNARSATITCLQDMWGLSSATQRLAGVRPWDPAAPDTVERRRRTGTARHSPKSYPFIHQTSVVGSRRPRGSECLHSVNKSVVARACVGDDMPSTSSVPHGKS